MPPGTLFPSPALCPLRSRQAPLHRHSRLPVSRPAGAPARAGWWAGRARRI